MQRTLHARSLALALTLAAGSAAALGAPPSYTLTEIPAPGGSDFVRLTVLAINNDGAITGQAAGGGQVHAFAWTPGSAVLDIRPSGTAIGSMGHAINGAGQIIGDACIPPPGGNGICGLHFFRYTPGVGTEQMNAGDGAAVFAGAGSFEADIADTGAIAGTANPHSSSSRALYYDPQTGWTDLTPLIPGGSGRSRIVGLADNGMALVDSGPETPVHVYAPWWGVQSIPSASVDAAAMNNLGDYTGRADFGGAACAFVAGVCMPPMNLDPLGQFPGSVGLLISDGQAVAGRWDGGLFLYTPETGMTDLGLDGLLHAAPTALNARGDLTIVAHSQMYEPLHLIKLRGEPVQLAQDAVDPMSTRIIVEHLSPINDLGQFVVTGRRPGGWERVAMLATPGDPCPADADRSGLVNSSDISAFLTLWLSDQGSPTLGLPRADFDGSGSTDSADISAFLGAWVGAVGAGGC